MKRGLQRVKALPVKLRGCGRISSSGQICNLRIVGNHPWQGLEKGTGLEQVDWLRCYDCGSGAVQEKVSNAEQSSLKSSSLGL